MAHSSEHSLVLPHALFIGRTTLDAIYWLDRLPQEDTKVFAQDMIAAPGGPACNAAITHALLGGASTLLTAIGSGPWAALARERLNERRIKVIDVATSSDFQLPLSTVLVARSQASRTIVNPPLADPLYIFPPEWNAIWGSLPAIAMTDGFHLEESLPLLRTLRKAAVPLCLDGGSWKTGTAELAPLLTSAICSERFAVPGTTGTPTSTLNWFADQGVAHVAITRGNQSIICFDRDRTFEIEIHQIDAADTLGAGDVLHGAFCGFAGAGLDFETSLRRAAEIAARSCQALGIDHLAEWPGQK